jgi:hypothetical protein
MVLSGSARLLLRSLLRYTKTPVVSVRQPLGAWLIPGVTAVYSAGGLKNAILYHFRTHEGTPSDLDKAFSAIRYLEQQKEVLKRYSAVREANRAATSRRKFEVGDVLLHSKGHFRGVCAGWAMGADGEQTIDVVINDSDCSSNIRLIPLPPKVRAPILCTVPQ